MEIRTVKPNEIEEIVNFNILQYPDKKVDLDKYIRFWFSKSEEEVSHTLIVLNDEGKIVGQNFFSTMSYFWNGQKYNSVWGFDLIVDESYRKLNWGVDLLLACKKVEPKSFATGSGPDALKMNLKLGQKKLGEIKKYVGILHPHWLPLSLFRKNIPYKKYVEKIVINKHTYIKIGIDNLPYLTRPYNTDLLEICRDKEFLEWRYFNDLHQYVFYKDSASDDYFVLRTIVQKNITTMVLVDYRCSATDLDGFNSILMAVKEIMRRLHLSFFVTGSSLGVYDCVLEKYRLRSVGRPRPIIGRIKVNDFKKDIDNRNFIFVTLADSDGETNWV